MLLSAIGISITMLTLLMAHPQNTISHIISFSVANMFFPPFMSVKVKGKIVPVLN
jgi:hypothetical protein